MPTARGRVSLEQGVKLASNLEVSTADLRPLRPAAAAAGGEALPLHLNAQLAIAGRNVSVDDIDGAARRRSTVRGRLAIDAVIAAPHRRRDRCGFARRDGADRARHRHAGAGRRTPAPAGAGRASRSPTALFGDYAGKVALKARRVELLPRLTAREFRANLRFGKDEFASTT